MNSQPPFWFDNVELRNHPWPGLNWMTAIVAVPDVAKGRELYCHAFGLVPIFDLPDPQDASRLLTTRLRYRGANILLIPDGFDNAGMSPATSGQQSGVTFYIYVDDVDAIFSRALASGMEAQMKPDTTPWGDRRARVRCLNGYDWDIAQRIMP